MRQWPPACVLMSIVVRSVQLCAEDSRHFLSLGGQTGLTGLGCRGNGFSQGPSVSYLPSAPQNQGAYWSPPFFSTAGEASATIPLVGIPKTGHLASVYSSAIALPHSTERPLPPSSPSNSIDGLLPVSPLTHPIAPRGFYLSVT